MIVAVSEINTANRLLLIGLSRGNIERLLAGQPVDISQKSHANYLPPGWNIGIFFGETEQDILQQLKGHGLVTPETEVDDRLKDR